MSLSLSLISCGGESSDTSNSASTSANTTTNPAASPGATTTTATTPATNNASSGANPSGPTDPSKYNPEIERLEKQAAKSPSEDAVRIALADLYVQRGNAYRLVSKFTEAERDYQNAIQHNPDNEEAQQGLNNVLRQTGRKTADESGEITAPIITPETDEQSDQTPTSKATPTPRKKKEGKP